MRSTKLAALVFGSLVVAAGLAASSDARAEDEFDVKVAGDKVVILAKGTWHINEKYPWKLTVGETKLDKTKFAITEKQATLQGAPKGKGTLKGAVCSADSCKEFSKEITVN
jgi:hypothetical protein